MKIQVKLVYGDGTEETKAMDAECNADLYKRLMNAGIADQINGSVWGFVK